jgi:hypothetical protein
MSEQDYERMVERLEQRYDNGLLETAIAAQCDGMDYDEACDASRNAIERLLFDSPHWEDVAATDISDIAYDYASRAWSQRKVWEGEV